MRFILNMALAFLVMLCIAVSARAEPSAAALPFLNPLFTNNMVLQRGQADPVWGWTEPGRTVTVRVAGQSAKAVAGKDCKWMAKLAPLPVGGPYTLTISGPETVTLHNVLVGDVWICSGQSNMTFGVGNLANPRAVVAAANYPNIRLYAVQSVTASTPKLTTKGQWEVCTPTNLAQDGDWNGFSAVGYFFGRDLYQNLHVPIGLIHTSWGGTPAEAWTSESALRAKLAPDFDKQLDELDIDRTVSASVKDRNYRAAVAKWFSDNDAGDTGGLGWADPALDDSAWPTMNLPGYFQDAGDPALADINGIVWFRRTFDVPAGEAGKDLVLNEMVDDNDTTWVNGIEVGATDGYNIQRAYTISASLLKPAGNVIAVRVLDTGGKGGIWGDASGLAIHAPDGMTIPLAGPWRYKLSIELTKTSPYPATIDQNPQYPTELFNSMINPLIPFGVKGAIWYQGENNAGMAYQYRRLLPTMIEDWRAHWGEGAFPFLIVQLAGYGVPPAQPGDDNWAELREAQWLTAQKLPNVGIATAIDIGDPEDIHPKNKQEVGRRLSLVARNMVYHQNVEDLGPVISQSAFIGHTVRMHFSHLGGGLVTKGGGTPKGFAVCGRDRKWRWADARIVGDTIIASSPDVASPTAVRYAWASGPIGNLASKDGLPMFPFRSDNFPLSTDWKHQGK